MRKYNNILNNLNAIVTENLDMKIELQSYKAAEKYKSSEPDSLSGSEILWMIDFGKAMLKAKFEDEIKYRSDRYLKFDTDGVVDKSFETWYNRLWLSTKTDVTPDTISSDRAKEMLRNDAEEVYARFYEEAKMEWVRSHKEED